MCNVVKSTMLMTMVASLAARSIKYTGFVSNEGLINAKKMTEDHLLIMTFCQSFEQHEKLHADTVSIERFDVLAEFCDET